jgi:hypothetical protein
MPKTETVLRVFVASPNDVADERSALEEIVRELNLIWSPQLGVRLDLVKWETHAFPGVGVDPQAVINDQIEDDYDIFVGIMWKRIGTPTSRANSGTIEEFHRAYERYKNNPDEIRIMFYFNDSPVPPSELDPVQLASIVDFKKGLGERGALYWTYISRDEFESLLRMHLSRQVQEWRRNWGTGSLRDNKESVEIINDQNFINNEEDEEGLIDLVEIGQESLETMNESVLRMTSAISDLGEKMSERTEEMNRIQTSGGQPNFKAVKRIVSRTSEDMEQFIQRMEPEVPIFTDSYTKAINAMIRVTSLSSEFSPGDEKGIEQFLEMVQGFKATIVYSLEGTESFKTTIASLPRITTEFNRSKRKTILVLDNLIEEMTKAVNLISELEKELQRLTDL